MRTWKSGLPGKNVTRLAAVGVAMGLITLLPAQVKLTDPSRSYLWPGTVTPRAWMPSGNQLIVTSVHGAHLWDVTSQSVVRTFAIAEAYTAEVALDGPGAKLFTASSDGFIRVWNVATADLLQTYPAPLDSDTVVATAPNANLFLHMSRDLSNVVLRNISDGLEIATVDVDLLQLETSPNHAVLSADGSKFALVDNLSWGSAVVWNRTTESSVFNNVAVAVAFATDSSQSFVNNQQINLQSGASVSIPHSESYFVSGINPLSNLLYLQSNPLFLEASGLRAVDLNSGELAWATTSVGFAVNSVLPSPDGGRLLLVGDNKWKLLNALTGATLDLRIAGSGSADVDLSRDGRWLVKGHQDGTTTIWDVPAGELKHAVTRPESPTFSIQSVGIHPDGASCIASVLQGLVLGSTRYRLETAEVLATYPEHGAFVHLGDGTTGCFFPMVSEAPGARIIALETGALVRELSTDGAPYSMVSASPSGELIATRDYSRLSVFSALTGQKLIENLTPGGMSVGMPAFSPDGTQLIVSANAFGEPGSPYATRQYSIPAGETIRAFPQDISLGKAASWSPNGKIIAYARYNESASESVWVVPSIVIADPRSGTLLGEIVGNRVNASKIGFTPDSRELWIVSTYGEVLYYDMSKLVALRSGTSPGNTFSLNWDEPEPGATYTLEESSDLLPNSWTPVTSNSGGSHETQIDQGAPAKYFRVRRVD